MSDLDTNSGGADPPRPSARDYTKGSLWSAVVALSLPMALDQVVTSVTRLVELYFLGRLGPEVLAASSIGSMAAFVMISVSMGVGIAALSMVARRVGEHDLDGAAHALWQALFLSAGCGVVFGALGVLSARPLLVALGARGEVLDEGARYLRVSFGLLPFLLLNLTTNRALRGAGEARTALWTMSVGSAVTAASAPVLILGAGPVLPMGIVGAALSAGIGQVVSWVLAVAALMSGRLRVQLRLRAARPDGDVLWRLVKVGAPVSVQLLLRSTSRLALAPLIAGFGAAALAAYGIMVRLMMFPLSIGFGLGNAAGTLVGQNLGAAKPRRAVESAWIIAGANVAMTALIVTVYLIFSRSIVSALVEGGSEVVEEGMVVLRFLAPTYLFSALGVVMGRALDGAGDTVPAMWVNLLTLWLVQLPVAWLLSSGTSLGSAGIWLGIGAANVLNAVILALWFVRGGWKSKQV